jgi:hypothetical protein
MKAILAVLLMLALRAAPARAALGEYESSVYVDQQSLHGADHQEEREGYRIHLITAPDGAEVKEYVSIAGRVFEVSWQAPRMPNLQQLLGSALVELQVALKPGASHRLSGPLVVRTDQLVFVSSGHMRAFHGYAYVPNLVPANVTPEHMR